MIELQREQWKTSTDAAKLSTAQRGVPGLLPNAFGIAEVGHT